MSEKYLRDWLNPNAPVVEEREREWLNPDTPVEIAPPPTPVVPEEEPEDSYWSQFSRWAGPKILPTAFQSYQRSKVVSDTVIRTGLRSADDMYNGIQDLSEFTGFSLDAPRANWEDEWLGDPQSAVEDIAADLGSWLIGFAVPGGVAAKTVTTVGKVSKLTGKVKKVTDLIGKSKRGQAVLKAGKIASEGALKGAVADFLATDVGDLRGEEAFYKRIEDVFIGAGIGAGVNLSLVGTRKLIKWAYGKANAGRLIKNAAEGKGDPTEALNAYKKSIDEEEALKEEFLSTIRPVDDRVDIPEAKDPTSDLYDQQEQFTRATSQEAGVWTGLSETEELFKTPVIDSTDFTTLSQTIAPKAGRVVPKTIPGARPESARSFDIIDTESVDPEITTPLKANQGEYGLEKGTPFYRTTVASHDQEFLRTTLNQVKDLITLDLGNKELVEVGALKTGRTGQGGKIYQVALQYAHNTDKVYIPKNLSFINVARTLGSMFSSALKNKTTKHFAPIGGEQADQMAAMGLPKGYKWGQDFQKDLDYLAIGERNLVKDRLSKTFKYGSQQVEKEGIKTRIPEGAREATLNLDDYKYSFEDDVFTGPRVDGSVGELSTKDINDLIKSVDPDFTLGVGASTFKRAVVTDSIEKMPFIVGDEAAGKIAERIGELEGVRGIFPAPAEIKGPSAFGADIDPKTREFLLKGDTPKTVSNTLDQLTTNAQSPEVRNLAKNLKELISDPKDLNVPIKYSPEKEGGRELGKYRVFEDDIELFKGAGEEILVHEILHGVTSRKINASVQDGLLSFKAHRVDEIIKDKNIPQPIRDLTSSFKTALEHPTIDRNLYQLNNLDEFLVGAFTDKNFQELLSKIPVEDNRNLFQKLVDAVFKLIGAKGDSNLLGKVIRDSADIISASRESYKGKVKTPITLFSKKAPQYAEAQIENYINKGRDLPDQINRLVRLNVELDNRMNPKINELVQSLSDFDERLVQGVDTNLQEQFDSIKNGVLNLEVDLQRYRKMIDIRAKAGNLSGKLLKAFQGKPKINFRKPVKYKPAVQKQLIAIDRLLTLIDDVKTGKLSNEKVLTKLKRELKNADDIANTGDLKSAVEKEFDATVDESIETIWDKYKSRISNQVLKTLRLNKGTNKAALDLFSDRITKTLTNAVKPNKAVTKTVNKTLDNLQDILSNPEKYKESIDVLIKDISTAKNLDSKAASDAVRILNDLKDGVQGKRFLEAMPNRDELIQKVLKEETDRLTTKIKKAVKEGTEKQLVEEVVSDISSRVTNLGLQEKEVLVSMIRAELGNTVSAIREQVLGNFITKEIYQKYALKQTIEEMDEMAGKSIAEIRDYLGATAKRVQTVPDDIRRLKEQARASRKVLTDKLKDQETAAYNEFVKDFLQSLGKMDAFGMEEMGNFELFLRDAEKFRLNSLLFSMRTWTVGLLSSSFNMAYLPFKQMLKKYSEVRQLQKAGVDSVYGPNASAMKLALQELTATVEYFNNWGDMFNILKATWKQNGHGAFNAKAFRRHEEDLISKTTKEEAEELKKSPIKLNFKNKEHLQRMVKKYGVDDERNKGLIRKFFEDIVEGEPTTKIGKLFDPLFSISFRAMGLFDQPFVFLGTMRALRAQALQEGLVKGLEGSALERFTKERMQEALKREGDVLSWAKNEEFKEASELGFTMVYQQEYADKTISNIAKEFSRWSRSSEDAYRRVDKILARLFVPFIKTPTAIAQWTVDNMPVVAQVNGTRALMGMNRSAKKLKEVNETILQNTQALKATPITKDQIKQIEDANEVLMGQREELVLKSAEEQAEAISNAVSSTVLGAGIFTAISTGTMTGSGAHLSDDQKARLRESGWRPNTIYIGGHKIDYSRFEPFSTMVSVWADVMHYKALANEGLTEDDQEWYNVLHASFMTNFADKYFLRGLKSFFSLLDQRPGNYNLEKAGVDFLSSLSPTIIRDINQMNEEFQTKAHGFKDKFLERSFGKFPGLYARNLLGEKVERQWQMEGAWGLVSPVYFAEDKRDKLMTELASIREDVGGRYSFTKTEVQKIDTRNYRDPKTGISLHDKWMDEMSSVRINGRTLRKTLERMVRTSRYKKASNFEVVGDEDTKANLVREVLSDFRKRAWSNIRKDRKLRRYEDSGGNNWFDVITGETSLIKTSTKERLGVVGISLPEQ